jgi:FkbM family methyltransferase
MLTKDEVAWGYRFMLGREPESEDVVNSHTRVVPDWRAFRAAILASHEFQQQRTVSGLAEKWVAVDILQGERSIWLDLADHFVSRACFNDNYEPLETEFVRRTLREGDTFIDIGANIGWFSLLASTIVGPHGRIHAFEPRETIARYLKRSFELNCLQDTAQVHVCGLDATEQAGLISWATGTNNAGSAALSNTRSDARLSYGEIQLCTLDSFGIDRVDFIKIDVEGAEMRAIQGGLSTINRCKPTILSEVHPVQLQAVSKCTARDYIASLKKLGYRAYAIDDSAFSHELNDFPECGAGLMNMIFRHSERVS